MIGLLINFIIYTMIVVLSVVVIAVCFIWAVASLVVDIIDKVIGNVKNGILYLLRWN